MAFTIKQLEKIAEPHIWCEYPFKDFQNLLFVYIIEGAASDRGAHGLCHWRGILGLMLQVPSLNGIYLNGLYNSGCLFSLDYDIVNFVQNRKIYCLISLDSSPPRAPFKVGESEWYSPPPTVSLMFFHLAESSRNTKLVVYLIMGFFLVKHFQSSACIWCVSLLDLIFVKARNLSGSGKEAENGR